MRNIFLALTAAFLLVGPTFAAPTTQNWKPGWDNLKVPLNYKLSKLTWSVNSESRAMSVTYTLKGAVPNSFYGAGVLIFCDTFPSTFGQFPTSFVSDGQCTSFTRQGVTKTAAGVLFGVITTDIHGNGSITVVVGPIAPDTYDLEFAVIDTGGSLCGDNGTDFQSPGPVWGDGTKITIP
jgi:hypothetical protein